MHFERLLSSHGNGRWTASPFVSHSVEMQATSNHLDSVRTAIWMVAIFRLENTAKKLETVVRVVEAKMWRVYVESLHHRKTRRLDL